MATVTDITKTDLLGLSDLDLEEEGRREAILNAMNHTISQLLRIEKNDPKRFKRGVIIVPMTCRKCGQPFNVQFSYQAFLLIIQINQISMVHHKKFAENFYVNQMLEKGRLTSIPVSDTFRYNICCPQCISKIKNGQIGKP